MELQCQNQEKTLRDYLYPKMTTPLSAIVFPRETVEAGNAFTTKIGTLRALPTFHGRECDDPYEHILSFENIVRIVASSTQYENACLKLFELSLRDDALKWFYMLRPQSLRTWVEVTSSFYKRYFSNNSDKKLIKIDISSDTVCPWLLQRNLDQAMASSKDRYDHSSRPHRVSLRDYLHREMTTPLGPIVFPRETVEAGNAFTTKIDNLRALRTFHGRECDNPYWHILSFENLVRILASNTQYENACLKLFESSLRDDALKWFRMLRPQSLRTWVEVTSSFYERYFSNNADKKLIKIDISSDTVCPWCFVGKRNLDQAMASSKDRYDFEITWHPYMLNPSAPKEGVNKKEFYQNKFGSRSGPIITRMTEVFRGLGLEYDMSGLKGNALDSHRLIYFAGQQGLDKQHNLVEELFLGYFTQGKYIGDREFLEECATKVGVEGAAEFLEDPSNGLKEVNEELEKYSQGITGVPYYVINGKMQLSGVQPPPVFERAFQTAASGGT